MIEIRPAQAEEVLREKELWKLAFGDDDSDIDYFFSRHGREQTLVLLEDGVLSTMVALFPVELALPDGKRLKSAYIYALATHPDARKKGFGRFLLSYVDFYLKARGMDCATIVPAEAGLHRYFTSVGFTECFTTRKMELLGYLAGKPAAGDSLAPAAPEEYRALRETLLAGNLYVSYSTETLDYQRGLAEHDRGGLFRLSVDGVTGCAAADYIEPETVVVRELLIPATHLAGAAALLAAKMPAVRYHLRSPIFFEGLPGSYPQPFAMVKWYDPAQALLWQDYGRGYMGLAFD